MDEFIGIIKLFAGNFAPTGWAFCSGQLLPISQNQALFAILGTTYGGDGRTTFALPDLRGRVPVGSNGTGPGLPPVIPGQMSGEVNHTLIISEMPIHSHAAVVGGTATLSVNSGQATQPNPSAGASIAAPGTLSGRTFTPSLGFNTTTPDTALNNASIATNSLTVTNANNGGSLPHNNMQPYVGLNYIICLQGLFPSRD